MAHRTKSATPRPLPPQSPLRTTAAVLAVTLLLAWAVFGRAIDAPFIFDDADSVTGNASIRQIWPLFGDADAPGPLNPPKYSATSGRPLVNLTLALNYAVGGLSPRSYHVLNLVLHALSAALLWAIVRRMLRLPLFHRRYDDVADYLAFAAAALWAVHPLGTEAVQYVTQRTELMAALCYLATLYASLRYWAAESPPQRRAWLTLAVFASACGMASKEVMATAPVMVLLLERTFITGSFRKALESSWPLYVGLAATWLLLLALNIGGPRGDTAGFGLGIPATSWWLTQSKVLWMYLRLTVFPWPLLIHYHVPYPSLGEAWPYVLATALLASGTLVLLWRRSAAGYALACVFAILAPTLIVPITTEVAAERRMYLPLAALLTLAVVGIYRLLSESMPRWVLATGAAVLAMIYGVAGAALVEAYHDPAVLWQQAVRHQPQNAMAQVNLGVALQNVGRLPEALEHYREAVRLEPDFLEAQTNLGLALMRAGRPEDAIEPLQAAVRLKPEADRIRNNLGVAYFTVGRLDDAIAEFQEVVKLKPRMWEAHDNLARALERAGRTDEAKFHFDEVARLRGAKPTP